MKFDGYRMQGHIHHTQVQFFTRSGLDWKKNFPTIVNALQELPITNAIFDGEVVALDEKGISNFQLLQNSIKSEEDSDLRYYIFDLLYLNGKDLRSLPLIERKGLLGEILIGAPDVIQFSEHIKEGGEDFYKVSCEHELEGIISKQSDAPYVSGRSDFWVKNKCSSRQEFVIGGWTDPQGERVGLGALLIGFYEKGRFRYAGRVGTGFNQEILKSLLKDLKVIEQDHSPFEVNSPRGRTLHWVKPKLVCEVNFANWTSDRVLRVPVFMGLRLDKPARVVQMEKPKSSAKLSLPKEVSSPDKILFKKEKITKKEIADFYEAIASKMLPYLANRPLSIVRCPAGSEGTCFFQKHINGSMPSDFHSFPVKEEKGSGIYFSINSSEGLRELVQLNAFEIHAWNSHQDDYMRPDQIVMDLDPGPGVSWKEVVDGAFEIKEMLEDLGLQSFVKLTGGKGLHIHVPIAPLYSWEQIKSFTQSLAFELERTNPKKYVSNMSKKLRHKKIFIDYLRNGYGATAVVPYSLRAKPLSAVALPVNWRELRSIKGPQEFTIYKALKKIKSRKKDPWEGMLKLKQKIAILTPIKKAS